MLKNSFLNICFLGIALGFLACGGEKPVAKEVIRPVRYAQVFSTGGSRARTFSGAARAGVEANLSFKIPGTVKSVDVQVGDRVKAGKTLAKLDPQDYQLQVQQTNAALQQAKAGLQKAKADYHRVRTLYENNNVAKSELDGARAAYESAKAAAEAADKQRELTRLQLSYTTLKAPTSGSIASVDVEVNENVPAGRVVVMLTSGSAIEVDVAIPEILISKIDKGSTVEVTFDAISGKKYLGSVLEVGVASVGFATTYPVTVGLRDAHESIRSGMAAEVKFNFTADSNQERIIIPSVAVGEDRQGRFVFVVEPVNGDTALAKRIAVEVGDLQAEGLEILAGLSEGDLVVTAGVSKIKNGQRVRL